MKIRTNVDGEWVAHATSMQLGGHVVNRPRFRLTDRYGGQRLLISLDIDPTVKGSDNPYEHVPFLFPEKFIDSIRNLKAGDYIAAGGYLLFTFWSPRNLPHTVREQRRFLVRNILSTATSTL